MTRTRVLIVGAAGRDFHNFNLVYRGREEYEVVAFTATQIPNIDGRVYPRELAGELYPDGIPIAPESELEVYPPSPTLRDILHSFGQVQTPLGLAELDMIDPQLGAAAHRLIDLVLSFRQTQIQTVAVLPELR